MRVPFVVAMIAVSAVSGFAAAVPMLETRALVEAPVVSAATPLSPVLVLDPEPIAAIAAAPSSQVTDLVESASRVLSIQSPERVDRLPRYLLLPDGALMISMGSPEGTPLSRDIVLREAVSPAAPEPRPVALPLNAPQLSRVDDAGPSTYFQGTRASAPAPKPLAAPEVFEPQTTSTGGVSRSYWAPTALAAIGAAAILGFALYHRIRPNAALENETRKTIFDAVCAQPGLGVHEVSKLAGVSYSTATYHLERLVGAGMIVMTPDGNKLCYYKNGGAFTESERRILPLIKNEEAAKLFEAILSQPGTYRAALAEQLGVTATTINWHLRRLREAGLVDETRAGRSAHLYAKIENLRPVFLQLATKVETTEPAVAIKLRGYAGPSAPPSTSASA